MISLFITCLLSFFCCSNINNNALDYTKEIEVKENCIKQVYYPQGQEGNPLWIPYSMFFDNYYFDNPAGFRQWASTEFIEFESGSGDSSYTVIFPSNSLFIDVDPYAYSGYVQDGGLGLNYLSSNCIVCNNLILYKKADLNYAFMYSFLFDSFQNTLKPYYQIFNYPGVYGGRVFQARYGYTPLVTDNRGIMIFANNPLYQIFNHDYENAGQSYDEGYADGYNYGYNWGKQVGINDAERAGYADGFADGKQEGYAEGLQAQSGYDPVALTIFTGIIDIGLMPVNFFLSILNFEVFGINIAGFVSSLLTIAIVIIVIRLVTGKKE